MSTWQKLKYLLFKLFCITDLVNGYYKSEVNSNKSAQKADMELTSITL